MKATIVFAQPGNNSFAHEILHKVTASLDKAGISYNLRDLYKLNFNPVLTTADMQRITEGNVTDDIGEEQHIVTDADLLVMVYPIWWWSQPAILKGWIDRVFTNNFAFRYEANGPVGLLTNKQAVVLTCTNESDAELRQNGFDTLIKKQIVDGILSFSGFKQVLHHNFAGVNEKTRQKLITQLDEVERILSKLAIPITN